MHMGVHMPHYHHVYTALTIYDMDWWPLQRANTMLAWILNWVKALKIHAYSNLDFKFAKPSKNEWPRIWFEVVLFKFMSRTLRSLCSIFLSSAYVISVQHNLVFSGDLVLSLLLDLWTYSFTGLGSFTGIGSLNIPAAAAKTSPNTFHEKIWLNNDTGTKWY